MTLCILSKLANAKASLFFRFVMKYGTTDFRPFSPMTLPAVLEQLGVRQATQQIKAQWHFAGMLCFGTTYNNANGSR